MKHTVRAFGVPDVHDGDAGNAAAVFGIGSVFIGFFALVTGISFALFTLWNIAIIAFSVLGLCALTIALVVYLENTYLLHKVSAEHHVLWKTYSALPEEAKAEVGMTNEAFLEMTPKQAGTLNESITKFMVQWNKDKELAAENNPKVITVLDRVNSKTTILKEVNDYVTKTNKELR